MAKNIWNTPFEELTKGKKKYAGEFIGVPREVMDTVANITKGSKTFKEMSGGKAENAFQYGALKTYQGIESFKKRIKKAFNQ